MTLTRKSAVHQASRPQLIDPNLGTMADRLRIQEHLDRSDGALASGTYVQLVNFGPCRPQSAICLGDGIDVSIAWLLSPLYLKCRCARHGRQLFMSVYPIAKPNVRFNDHSVPYRQGDDTSEALWFEDGYQGMRWLLDWSSLPGVCKSRLRTHCWQCHSSEHKSSRS